MKRLFEISKPILLCLTLALQVHAQHIDETTNVKVIPAVPISITNSKTTNLVFPYKIIGIDRGTKVVLVQKAHGADNVLQLKAAAENFEETNLSVITSDGRLYCFVLSFSKHPDTLNFQFLKDSSNSTRPAMVMPPLMTDVDTESAALFALQQPRSIHGIHDKKYGMRMQLEGLFIKGDVLFVQLRLQNKSTIDYDVDWLHFSISDCVQAKRTAVQEIPMTPLFSIGNTGYIKSDSTTMVVIAMRKFTIPDRKWLIVQMLEKNGGRQLSLKIKNKIIMRAKRIEAPALTSIP